MYGTKTLVCISCGNGRNSQDRPKRKCSNKKNCKYSTDGFGFTMFLRFKSLIHSLSMYRKYLDFAN